MQLEFICLNNLYFPVSEDKTMKVYDLLAGKVILDVVVGKVSDSRAYMICDETAVIVLLDNKSLGAWDIATGNIGYHCR